MRIKTVFTLILTGQPRKHAIAPSQNALRKNSMGIRQVKQLSDGLDSIEVGKTIDKLKLKLTQQLLAKLVQAIDTGTTKN
jgi:hypothetical protein